MGVGNGNDIKTDVIWIDPCIDNEQNTKYVNELKSMDSLNLKLFKNINEAINYLKYIKFNETKFIVSGKLYIKFIKSFKDNILDMNVAPKIVIFTSNIDKFIEYNMEYKNFDIFYKNGGITVIFGGIKEFLRNNYEKILEYKLETKDLSDSTHIQLTFEYIDSKKKLMLPLLFQTLIDDVAIDNMKQYTNLLYNTYSKENYKLKNLLSSIKSIPNIPIEILSKYYARLYTVQSSFYQNLNKNLGLNKIENYLPFIQTLYEGVKLKAFPLAFKDFLYRGSKISNEEIEKIKGYAKKKIKNLPSSIVFSKSFLSFTKLKSKAEFFLNRGNNDKNLYKVLYIVEKDEKMDFKLSTHGNIENISFYPDEKEVLFFPFSSFEIKEINEINIGEEKGYQINLLYLGKYLKDIENDKNLIMSEENLPDSEFKKQLLEFGLINKELLEKINPKLLYKQYKKYETEIYEMYNNNAIIGEINIRINDINKNIQIINSYENIERKKKKFYLDFKNEKEIKENIEIEINGIDIEFSYVHKFKKEGNYKIKYLIKNNLTKINHLFYNCSNLINLKFLNFNTQM